MSVRVRLLAPGDVGALTRFFTMIASDESVVAFFRPHPFDEQTATRICLRQGIDSDEYFAVIDGEEVVAYGMLRGWDEGYEVPAFGVCVRADQRGKGLGRALLDFAADAACQKGASSMMLKVYEDNSAARVLYERAGFTFGERTADGSQLVGRLLLGKRSAQ